MLEFGIDEKSGPSGSDALLALIVDLRVLANFFEINAFNDGRKKSGSHMCARQLVKPRASVSAIVWRACTELWP